MGIGVDGKPNNRNFVLETVPRINSDQSKPTKLLLSIDCLNKDEVKMTPVGVGRSDPNQDPYLPSPKGRFQFSLNPLKLLNQLVGPNFRNKLCFFILMLLLCCLIVFFLPGMITSIIANLLV